NSRPQGSTNSELEQRRKSGSVALSDIVGEIVDSGTLRHTRLARIEAVAEFRLRIGQDCPVDEFRLRTEHDCLSKHLHRLGVYTQLTCTPSQIGNWEYTLNPYALSQTGSIHSTHMPSGLGVYTQPTCPLCSLPGVYTQPTCPLCNVEEEMEKTHLIRYIGRIHSTHMPSM
ncbi:unnamed protein product, partial [Rodentolepis nana]|uniref:C2H2-type domain-containing protein n=1 Tax=Rodentolepis nana TaxID=102285 RepID=A0A0R3TAY7_RODNA